MPARPRVARTAAPRRAEVARIVVPERREPRTDVVLAAPTLSASLAPTMAASANRAALRIQIEAKVNDGTLAVFADRDLLLTKTLHAGSSDEPIQIEHALAVGPHQLRVALYRADKTLQTEKEGLGEIRTDTENTLTIRVSKRSKMLVKRETSLEVIWPSAIAPVAESATNGKSSLAIALK